MNEIAIHLNRITPYHNGAEVRLEIQITDGVHSEERTYCIAAAMLFSLELHENSDISSEKLDEIAYQAQLFEAIQRGLSLLAYSENTKKALLYKLRQRGTEKILAEQAVEYLEKSGFIKESEYLSRAVHYYAEKKLYGKNRIKAELFKKGFDRKIIDKNFEIQTNCIDFIENCAKIIGKHGGMARLKENTAEKQKLIAALIRYGYSMEEIRTAAKLYDE